MGRKVKSLYSACVQLVARFLENQVCDIDFCVALSEPRVSSLLVYYPAEIGFEVCWRRKLEYYLYYLSI